MSVDSDVYHCHLNVLFLTMLTSFYHSVHLYIIVNCWKIQVRKTFAFWGGGNWRFTSARIVHVQQQIAGNKQHVTFAGLLIVGLLSFGQFQSCAECWVRRYTLTDCTTTELSNLNSDCGIQQIIDTAAPNSGTHCCCSCACL